MQVRATDPEAMDNAKALLKDVEWFESEYDAAAGADVLIILTEWNAYRGLDLERMKGVMREPALFDMRNIYRDDELDGTGFRYRSIGRPSLAR